VGSEVPARRHRPVQVAVPYLDHPSPAVRRATATRYLARVDAALPEQVWAGLAAAATPAAARIVLRLRQKQGTWERVSADLDAMTARGDLEDLGRRDLLAWLQRGAASTYTRLTPDQATHLAHLFEDVDLAESTKREIAFTAGLPAPAAPTTQALARPSRLGKLLTWRNRTT
jgi:hypothetical protein